MSKFYAKSTGGFYDDKLHQTMPKDAVPVTEVVYATLFAAQADGRVIQADANGNPVAIDPPPPPPPTIAQQIVALESTATPRRIREAELGIDGGWLKALNDQIVALRAKL